MISLQKTSLTLAEGDASLPVAVASPSLRASASAVETNFRGARSPKINGASAVLPLLRFPVLGHKVSNPSKTRPVTGLARTSSQRRAHEVWRFRRDPFVRFQSREVGSQVPARTIQGVSTMGGPFHRSQRHLASCDDITDWGSRIPKDALADCSVPLRFTAERKAYLGIEFRSSEAVLRDRKTRVVFVLQLFSTPMKTNAQNRYADYLASPEWKQVAQSVKARDKYRCRLCNSQLDLAVHHRDYAHRGCESQHMEDLVTLCGTHHDMVHGKLVRPPQIVEVVKEVIVEKFVAVGAVKQKPVSDEAADKWAKERVAEIDALMPEGDPVILTVDLINRCMTNGSFTSATLRALGLNATVTGWARRASGTPVSRAQYRAALECRFVYASKKSQRRAFNRFSVATTAA